MADAGLLGLDDDGRQYHPAYASSVAVLSCSQLPGRPSPDPNANGARQMISSNLETPAAARYSDLHLLCPARFVSATTRSAHE
ncbi:hypothetical protein CMUS01_03570 [Colletotrichum musicola]|uniref:Uncharacterized protein n=1 Tax=Colletotrichum musicola TaxID=2175873 RepID=A0A8H6U5F2_9PEZI|nr:hypothetical protein CMUS01_03570 [Colletotrichum musicola]